VKHHRHPGILKALGEAAQARLVAMAVAHHSHDHRRTSLPDEFIGIGQDLI
jgi:hypothetical protein